MIESINFLLSLLPSFIKSLSYGDIITTGTPPGVGMGKKPQIFLKPGDQIDLAIECLGSQKQKVTS